MKRWIKWLFGTSVVGGGVLFLLTRKSQAAAALPATPTSKAGFLVIDVAVPSGPSDVRLLNVFGDTAKRAVAMINACGAIQVTSVPPASAEKINATTHLQVRFPATFPVAFPWQTDGTPTPLSAAGVRCIQHAFKQNGFDMLSANLGATSYWIGGLPV